CARIDISTVVADYGMDYW
nr:immunoglobulin heavy chain junction region [Mus musculus]MBK4188311.1 immunoglobulin heavy chain junction region [Mus musculus]MBK4188323.1 immunoglobulin heavy chain junction region [Mus musculus]MBK4188324.1 immunoglobulin heavy chain junction region [Mus musculus]MBK4188325.1 immunoglobulin heavy chain junction region [Mus musculus]